jgi:hypothetical protein
MCLNLITTTILKGQLKQFDCKNPRCGETVTPPDFSDFANKDFILQVRVSYLCRKCGEEYESTIKAKVKNSCKITVKTIK